MSFSLKFLLIVALFSVAANAASLRDIFFCAGCAGKVGSPCDFDEFDEMAPAVLCSFETYDNSTCISFTFKDADNDTFIVRDCGNGFNCQDNLPINNVTLDYCSTCNTPGCNDEVFH